MSGTGSNMSKHRIDALTDGIFAVAMTLLVIELKIPESMHIKANADLLNALAHLIPEIHRLGGEFFSCSPCSGGDTTAHSTACGMWMAN